MHRLKNCTPKKKKKRESVAQSTYKNKVTKRIPQNERFIKFLAVSMVI